MKGKTKEFLAILIALIIIICPLLPAKVFAGEGRSDIIWLNPKSDNIVSISLNVLKSRRESYGMEFTSPKNKDNPKNFTSGNYSAQGMIRLSRSDELIFRTNGRWIGGNQEKDGGMVRTPFARDVWHNIKVEFNRIDKTMTWYLDGEELGTTAASNDLPLNAISVFCDSIVKDGLKIVAVTETSEEESNLTATDTYKYVFRNKQGTNNWYFCEFGDYSDREMVYTDGRWYTANSAGYIGRGVMLPGTETGVGAKYVAHKNGLVRLNGTVAEKEAEGVKGNGVVAEIRLGNKTIWRGVATYGSDVSYNITTPVKQGETISFIVYNNGNHSYDWTAWTPQVEYINGEYSYYPDEYTYYQKNLETLKTTNLTYNQTTKRFEGEGGYVDGFMLSPCEGYSLGKSFSALKEGRYRLYGKIINNSSSDGVVTVYKNGEEIWSQMYPEGETGSLDIRAYLKGGESLRAELSTGGQSDELIYFDAEVERIPGTMFADETMSQSYSTEVLEEYLLSDLIGNYQGENGMSYYFIHKDIKSEMAYNSEKQRWENTDGSSGGFISKTAGYSGAYTDTIMEWSVPKDGTVRIDGDIFIADTGDGTLCRIYKNDEVVWTNRVGGERLVRWDEPYDTSYFSNTVNVTIPVLAEDKISFLFDQWRIADNDTADFSNVKISFIKGDILSETTKWKINKSTVFDIKNKTVYVKGVKTEADIYEDNGAVYISGKSANEILGMEIANEGEYVLLSEAVEDTGQNFAKVEQKIAVSYAGLPMQFGYSEASELNSMLNPTTDWDTPVTYSLTDENGTDVLGSISGNRKYFVSLEAENYVGESYTAKVLLAEYNADGVMIDIKEIAEREIKVGTKYLSDKEISFTANPDAGYIRLFVWDGFENINPLSQSSKYNVAKQQ